jgi:hypothetical protein
MVSTSLRMVLVLGLLAMTAQAGARGVRIDFEDSNFDFTGQAWDTLQFVDVENDGNSVEIDLGFSIDFGDGLVDSLFINENGYVSFDAPIVFDGGIGALSELNGDVVAPYYANLQSTTPTDPSIDNFFDAEGSVSYSTGRLDTQAPFEDQTTAPRALRITWYNVLDSNADPVLFQALFLEGPAAGDFDLELNFGSGTDLPAPSLSGFVLGANSAVLNSGFASEFDYTYRFRGGVLDGSTEPPPTAVSEPGSMLLLCAGLLLLALAAVRRGRITERPGALARHG